jgi:subtilisin family serine protease
VSVSLQTDPLYQHQWHLDNTGQLNFASTVGTASKDINVDSVINEGYTGNNVIVAIVDSGLEIAHEDLTQNVVANGSYNFLNNSTDPTNASTTGDHGTSVTGIIGARGWNKIGGRGIAPKASLKGFNMLKASSYANAISSLGGAAYSSDVDVFNLSYGYETDDSFLINSSMKAQYIDGITNLRSGKGAIYVAAGGNGFRGFGDASCAAARANGVSCQNVSMDPEQSIPYVIVVGALDAVGTKSTYSTAGSAFWISAPGGEYGEDINYGDYGGPYTPAIMTTDQSTCDKGYVRSNQSYVVNAFDNKGNHSENTACNYTSTFNGTSSAAPVVAGSVALLLEANPNLTWRDIKHILATSATQVDANIEAKVIDEYIAEPAWTTNAAGYKFHNWYGFGGIDVAAALTLAKNYSMGSLGTFVISTEKTSGTLNTSIPDDSNTGVTNAINDSNNLTIEAINAYVCLSHDRPSDLSIALSSPQGTRSVLLPPFNGFSDVSSCFNIISNMFYGENSNGNWTIKIVDKKSGTTGSIGSWKLTVFGR